MRDTDKWTEGEERREVSREIIHGRAQLTTSLMIEVEDRGRDEITERLINRGKLAVPIWRPIRRFKVEFYGYYMEGNN